jgi:hypothetical protein
MATCFSSHSFLRSLSPQHAPRTPKMLWVTEIALKEAVERFNHELLDDEERLMLLERIKRLRRTLS